MPMVIYRCYARENFNKDIVDTWHQLKESISIQNNIEKI